MRQDAVATDPQVADDPPTLDPRTRRLFDVFRRHSRLLNALAVNDEQMALHFAAIKAASDLTDLKAVCDANDTCIARRKFLLADLAGVRAEARAILDEAFAATV